MPMRQSSSFFDVSNASNRSSAVVKALKDDHDVKKATAYRLISEAIAGGVLRTSGPANKQTLILTGKLQPKHRVEDTGHE